MEGHRAVWKEPSLSPGPTAQPGQPGTCVYILLGIRMRIMPRARCIQYTCNGKTQNVLFFVDNDMNEIILPGPLTLLFFSMITTNARV